MIYGSKMYMSGASKSISEVKWKTKALQHLKVNPVLEIYATFHGTLDLYEIYITDSKSVKSVIYL